jgi:hypothetical protein
MQHSHSHDHGHSHSHDHGQEGHAPHPQLNDVDMSQSTL